MSDAPPVMFISDLHLPPSNLDGSASMLSALSKFINDDVLGKNVSRLVILGDLFEYWFETYGQIPAEFKAACDILKAATQQGLCIFVIRGNRDFLLGPAFLRATGARLLPDTVTLRHGGRKVMLTHGDLLVRGDRRYLAWRWFSRSELFRGLISLLPSFVARRIAGGLRKTSEMEKNIKSARSMRFAESTLERIAKMGYDILIAGHTHIPEKRDVGAMRLITLGCGVPLAGYYLAPPK